MTFMPNAESRCATRTPIRPRPTMPTVFSYSSMPVYFERFHSPCFNEWWAGETCRAAASIRATASSAAETMLEVGALTTITPACVAARTSTLSRPTPARATIFSLRAAASASASTLVAERTSSASTSTIAGSSSARSAPLHVRISKSGPSASTVAGLSSSAMSTTGLSTACPRCVRGGGTGARLGGVRPVVHDAVPGCSNPTRRGSSFRGVPRGGPAPEPPPRAATPAARIGGRAGPQFGRSSSPVVCFTVPLVPW